MLTQALCYLVRVSSFEREMSEAVKDVQRTVFLDLIRAHPEMTLAELSKLSRGQFSGLLSSVTVGEVIRAGRESLHADMDELARSRAEEEDVNTRTAAGRRDYDARVLEFIRASEEPVSATEIRNHINGTSLQVRKAVARLIEAELVTWHGKARGTRYSVL
ncbi:winged helix DNA-binding protein [Nannocystaceae bacterium ST9]